MWPKEFSRNIILVPDFGNNKSTGLTNIFGIEENIVLGTWRRENTYFGYELKSYDIDLGSMIMLVEIIFQNSITISF